MKTPNGNGVIPRLSGDIRPLIPTLGLRNYWYPAVADKKIGPRKPMKVSLLGEEICLFRGATGNVVAIQDVCPHRGARLSEGDCHYRGTVACPYHGWVYDSAGRLLDMKDGKHACYPEAFVAQNHDLVAIPRFESYRGFLFGSLNAAVAPLAEHLGDARIGIDLVVDQSPDGVELLRGTHSYTFNANWKLQIENCVDAYHLTSTHPSYIEIVNRRKSGESANQMASVDFGMYKDEQAVRGSFCFDNGYNILWGVNPAFRARPLHESLGELRERVGEVKARWMLYMRNLTLFPNAQFAENASLQLRVLRPIAVDKTEMTTWCVAPRGESTAARTLRIRQYEDFFNASGLATPDDSMSFEDCQAGYQARLVDWQQGYVRGMGLLKAGGNAYSDELGVTPRTSVCGPFDVQDETIFHSLYREWLRLLTQGMAQAAERPVPMLPMPARAAR